GAGVRRGGEAARGVDAGRRHGVPVRRQRGEHQRSRLGAPRGAAPGRHRARVRRAHRALRPRRQRASRPRCRSIRPGSPRARPRLAGLVLSGPAIGLGPAIAQMIDAGFVDQPLDVTALSRDPAVGEAYAVDPLVWHGAWKRPTIAAPGHAQEAVDRGPTFADLPLLWIHGTEDPLVPIAFVRLAVERLRGADFTAYEHEGGRHEVFN